MGAILQWYGDLQMKITNVETLIADGGWRPWIYVKIETDEGVTGYGECTDPRSLQRGPMVRLWPAGRELSSRVVVGIKTSSDKK